MIPAPRAELAIHPQDEGVLLGDRVVGQQVALGVQSTAVWHALRDGHTSPQALEAALPHLPRATLRARLAQLAQASVLDDARWQAQRPLFTGLRAAPAPAEATVRVAAGLRHRCVRCGSSCSGAAVGPIDAATRPTLDALAAARGARDADDLLTPLGELQVMARQAEACVALDAGDCAVERLGGRAAKPAPCRLFPHGLTWAPDGLRVGLSAECRRLLDCLDAGAALGAEDAARADTELRELASGGLALPLPDPVQLAPGVFVPLAEFLPRYDGLTQAAEARGALVAWLDERLAALPPLPWLDADRWGDPPASTVPVAHAGLWRAIAQAAAKAAHDAAAGGEGWSAERSALAARAAEVLAGDARLPPLTAWGDGHARLRQAVLQGGLAALEPVQRRDVLWGLGRLHVLLALGEAVAGVRAARVARAGYTAADLNDGLVVASLTLRAAPVELALGQHGAAVRWLYGAGGGPWRAEYGFLP
ncbi:MAG: hypothetical protein H6702_21335 [Myxococcales bacterium]|nr:hypothetical protein [Myxococcales bacterium]